MARTASAAGLRVVDDRRLRFALPLGGADDARRFVRSLYLPTVSAGRHEAAGEVAVRWVGTAIGVPLRRVTLRPAW
jgi:hypothetical protein